MKLQLAAVAFAAALSVSAQAQTEIQWWHSMTAVNGEVVNDLAKVDTVPAMRMVVDMAHLNRSRWVNLAGSSGHAFSGKYVYQRSAWSRGVSPTWPWTSEAIEANAEDTLVLAPGD